MQKWITVCISISKSNFVVRVADFNLRRKEMRPQQALTMAIEKLVVHPQYRKDRKYDNDIALVRISLGLSLNNMKNR